MRWLDTADARLRRLPPSPAGRRRRRRGAGGAGRPPGGAVVSAMLELRQVSKVYGEGDAEVHALRDVDLSVAPGELVAIMGPSGSGKSSLLTIAGSLEDATSGEVVVGGASLPGMSRNDKARLRRRSIGFVFQDFNLLSGLTAPRTSPCRSSSTAPRPVPLGHRDDRARGARRRRPGRALPRRPLRRRAPAGGDRPCGRRRPPAAAGRRADRRARLGQQRGRDAAAANDLPRRRPASW